MVNTLRFSTPADIREKTKYKKGNRKNRKAKSKPRKSYYARKRGANKAANFVVVVPGSPCNQQKELNNDDDFINAEVNDCLDAILQGLSPSQQEQIDDAFDLNYSVVEDTMNSMLEGAESNYLDDEESNYLDDEEYHENSIASLDESMATIDEDYPSSHDCSINQINDSDVSSITLFKNPENNYSFKCQTCLKNIACQQYECGHIVCESCEKFSVNCSPCAEIDTKIGDGFIIRSSKKATMTNVYFGRKTKMNPTLSFYRFPTVHHEYMDLEQRQKFNRRNSVLDMACLMDHGDVVPTGNEITIIEDTIKHLKIKFKTTIDKHFPNILTLKAELVTMMRLNVTKNARRDVKGILIKSGNDVFNTTAAYENLEKQYQLKSAKYITSFVEVEIPIDKKLNKKSEKVSKKKEEVPKKKRIPFTRIANIKQALDEYFEMTKQSLFFHSQQDKLWLKIGIDKGGGTTKVTLSVMNRPIGLIESSFNVLNIAAYNDEDKYESLLKYCGPLFEDLEKIKQVTIGDVIYDVQLFIIGDLMSISAVRGLMGPMSRFPCVDCTTPMIDVKRFLNTGKERTLEDFNKHFCPGSSTIKNLSFEHKPILGWPHVKDGCPYLHCFQSPVSEAYKCMEVAILLKMKSQLLGVQCQPICLKDDIGEKMKEIRSISEVEAHYRTEAYTAAKNYFEAVRSGTDALQRTIFCYKGCCLTGRYAKNAATVLCRACGHSEHMICCGVKTKTQFHICWICSIIHMQADVNSTLFEDKLVNLWQRREEVLQDLKDKDAFEKAYSCSELQQYWKICDSVGIKLGAFHGKLLPGNHVHNFLRSHDVFTDYLKSIDDNSDTTFSHFIDVLHEILDNLNNIHKLCAARFLNKAEIEKIEDCAYKLQQVMANNNIREGTTKWHYLLYEIPKFARTHQSIGIFGEQSVESNHVQFGNSLAAQRSNKDLPIALENALKITNQRNIVLLENAYTYQRDSQMPQLAICNY